MTTIPGNEPVLAPDADCAVIRELDTLLAGDSPPAPELIGDGGKRVRLPASVYTLLRQVVHELARGHAVRVLPLQRELTTQQAADLLNVSRPFLVRLLETGEIPFHRVGTHRRVRVDDLMQYRRRRSETRRAALAEMAREAQEMGLYE